MTFSKNLSLGRDTSPTYLEFMKYSCYYIIHLARLMGFTMHFYITFGTNLLTQSPEPSASSCLFPCFSVSKKRNIKRSRNRMKPSGEVIFGRKATR